MALALVMGRQPAAAAAGEALFQALAHALDQILQHAHFAGQLLGAALGVVLHGLAQAFQAGLNLLQLFDQDQVGVADGADLAGLSGPLELTRDHVVDGEGQAQPAHEAGNARAPSAARAP